VEGGVIFLSDPFCEHPFLQPSGRGRHVGICHILLWQTDNVYANQQIVMKLFNQRIMSTVFARVRTGTYIHLNLNGQITVTQYMAIKD